MMEVQSFIFNSSFPKSLEELLELWKSNTPLDIEVLTDLPSKSDLIHSWSAPKWIKPGDVVFFMYSKSSVHTIKRLKILLEKTRDSFSIHEVEGIRNLLEKGQNLYNKYGGKIFAVARVTEMPYYLSSSEIEYSVHWKSRIYAYVDENVILDRPITLAEFSSFIKLSCGGTITPVFGKEYEKLKSTIRLHNAIPPYLENSVAMPIPFAKINELNWLSVTFKYRRNFMYESQFRTFYVDYLLKALGDRKTIYSECACKKEGIRTSFIDNVIVFGSKYLPVEVKLSVSAEADLKGQVDKYCNLAELYLDKKENKLAEIAKVYRTFVLIIDTDSVYLYSSKDQKISKVYDLDSVKEKGDIVLLQKCLKKLLVV